MNLILRILTAAIGIPLLYCIIRYGGVTGTKILSLLISLAMIAEYTGMSIPPHQIALKAWNWIAGGVFTALCVFNPNLNEWYILIFLMLNSFVHLSGASLSQEPLPALWTSRAFTTWFGWLYCGFCISFLGRVAAYPEGWTYVLFLFALVWVCDTGAYFAGRTIGGPKLCPRVSPGKTWSGAIGGTIATGLTGALAAHQGWIEAPVGLVTAFSIVIAIVSQAGDLFESLLKRSFGFKDSGNLLPGHGGFLDRFDGFIFCIPVLYLALQLYTQSQWL